VLCFVAVKVFLSMDSVPKKVLFKRRWAPQTTCDTLKGVKKSSTNEIELIFLELNFQ